MHDPHHGIRPPNRSSKADPAGCWPLVLFTCMSLWAAIALIEGLRLSQQESQLSKRGIPISGIITDRRQDSYDAHTYISYRFPVSRSNITNYFSREERVDYHIWKALDGVRFVKIHYLPENPRVSRLELAGFRSSKTALGVVVTSAVLSLSLLTLVCAATGWEPFSKKHEWVLGADGNWRSRKKERR